MWVGDVLIARKLFMRIVSGVFFIAINFQIIFLLDEIPTDAQVHFITTKLVWQKKIVYDFLTQ